MCKVGIWSAPKMNRTRSSSSPTVQVLGLREVRVATQQHAAKSAAQANVQRPIDFPRAALVAWPVARAIDHAQHLARIGQRHDQRMITPLALVRDVHPRLALARGGHQRAVHVDAGFVEERVRLLRPDFEPRLVEHVEERANVVGLEAAAEVAGRGGIGNAPGIHRVEIHFVVAAQFQIFQAGASHNALKAKFST